MHAGQRTVQRDKSWREIEEAAPQFMAAAPAPAPASKKRQLTTDGSSKRWRGQMNAVVVALVMAMLPVVVFITGRRPAVWIQTAADGLRRGSDAFFLHPRLLGGLLLDGFDQETCHSRYQSAMYRRNSGRQPSSYLISKLRRQEALQRRCGPGTAAYRNAVEQLRSGESVASPECKYIVSISYCGLGNRILAAASAFLYAVLTDRVVLIDPSNDMDELFCEPFPGTTWLMPRDFPVAGYTNFSVDSAESYGNMVKNRVVRNDGAGVSTAPPPALVYVHLNNDYTDHDRLFYCDEDQRLLRRVQWLVMRTNSYIVPGLFLLAGFREELGKLFPEPDAVFHHLGRYLFHPNNLVWGLVTRYYEAYLSTAQKRVGIQVRVFGADSNSPELVEQITTCTQKNSLLPEVLGAGSSEPMTLPASGRRNSTAGPVTSLKSWYYERIRSMYWENAAAAGGGGGAGGGQQPSHEEYQHFGAKSHDAKAWAEIYLLSLTDELVTTGKSTFGYVAQGLAGVRPWVMQKPWNRLADQPCWRDVSMEPCFHRPPYYDCQLKRWADPGKVVPHVQHCGDVSWGLKTVNR
uniref:Fucosyltransferase n=1 Tax=Oryza brachyantha TaxID=4533 RepID=J3MCB3_ORYBR